MKKIQLIIMLVCFGFTIHHTIAQTTTPKKVNYTIGAGLGFTPQYEGASDIFALPAIAFAAQWNTGQYIRLSGLGIEANVLADANWEFGPKLGFKLARNEDIVDDSEISAMEEIEFATAAGLFARYKFAKGFDIKTAYTHDISGVNDGGVAAFELGYTLRNKRLITRFSTSTSYATAGYLETYFGVTTANRGSSNLPLYAIESGFKDIGTTVNLTYILNQKWMLSTQLGYTLLLGDVADSPVVEAGSTSQISGGVIAMYRF
ncbi:MipA/OmpV family protein [Aquimarina rhabdastrellae]